MLDFFFRSLHSAFEVAERQVAERTPLAKTEEDILDAVQAIHRATDSIEHHVEVIEGLATSVGPLTNSVNELTAAMVDLVGLMAPIGAAEHGVQETEHFFRRFGRHHHDLTDHERPDQASVEPRRGDAT